MYIITQCTLSAAPSSEKVNMGLPRTVERLAAVYSRGPRCGVTAGTGERSVRTALRSGGVGATAGPDQPGSVRCPR